LFAVSSSLSEGVASGRKRVAENRHLELIDGQGELVAVVLPEPQLARHGGPKPVPNWPVVEGIRWVLRISGRSKALPDGCPSPSTCWRPLAQSAEDRVWLQASHLLRDTLHEQGRLDGQECFAADSFVPAEKGRRRRKNQTGQGSEVDGGRR
jgi:transposase